MTVSKLPELIANLTHAVKEDVFWSQEIERCLNSTQAIHLAIFVEPFLQWILDGRKVIESRFSINRCAPYKAINKDDIIVLKKSGGPVVALAKASTVWFYNIDPQSLEEIKDKFAELICAYDPQFWESRKSACYASLILLEKVYRISSFDFPKKDRRGWVVVKPQPVLKLDL